MKRFSCACGAQVFFENTRCLACNAVLGIDPQLLQMITLPATSVTADWIETSEGARYRHCQNRLLYKNCNWLLGDPDPDAYCMACRLNRTIPNLSTEENLGHWTQLERAKRRLVFALLDLRLPVQSQADGWPFGLAFDFVEDKRSNPLVEEEHVSTGHAGGVITINVAEADDVLRAMARKQTNESYRTLLGHFRHESGHYYFEFLINDEERAARFGELFGNPAEPYDAALTRYYDEGPKSGWESSYISAYAASHPAEDWAETWAHCLHMIDTLETAGHHALAVDFDRDAGFDAHLREWMRLTIAFNDLNRSMGLRDAYPFVINPIVADKLRFIHGLLAPGPAAN